MNEKHAKRCRAITRWECGKDWREAVEEPKKEVIGMRWDPKHFVFAIPYVEFSGQRVLHPECGRAQYKQVKRDYERSPYRF